MRDTRGAARLGLLAVVLGAALVLSGAKPRGPAGPPLIDLAKVRVVDLTHPFDEKTLYWPTSPSGFQLRSLSRGQTAGGYFYSANAFSAPEHGGTHLDAPVHFAEGHWSVDEIPVERLLGPALVIDVTGQAKRSADYRLTVQDVQDWERDNGNVPAGAIVLLRTGWASRWPNAKRYLGSDTPGDASHLHFPSYGPEAAAFLVEHRQVAALGVDTASIDYGASGDFLVHRLALQANVYGLENLADLADVPETGAWIMAMPMKIKDGSGAPVRVVALVPR